MTPPAPLFSISRTCSFVVNLFMIPYPSQLFPSTSSQSIVSLLLALTFPYSLISWRLNFSSHFSFCNTHSVLLAFHSHCLFLKVDRYDKYPSFEHALECTLVYVL